MLKRLLTFCLYKVFLWRTKFNNRLAILIGLVLLLIPYLFGYFLARESHLLIHQVGCEIEDGQPYVARHDIIRGDVIGGLQPGLALIVSISYYLFGPIRLIERLVWYVTVRPGALWRCPIELRGEEYESNYFAKWAV